MYMYVSNAPLSAEQVSFISFRKILKEAAILAVTTTCKVVWCELQKWREKSREEYSGNPRAYHETVGSWVAFLYSFVCFVLFACLFGFFRLNCKFWPGNCALARFSAQACPTRKLEKRELRAPIFQTVLSTAADRHITLAKNSHIPVYFLFISLTPAFSLCVYYVYQWQQKKKKKKKKSD